MNCEECNTDGHYRLRCVDRKWMCADCLPRVILDESWHIVDTINFKNYKNNNGNVSKARINEMKRRAMAPDGNGEVILKSKFGRYTDKKATL